MRELPKLTDAVVRADIKGEPSYDITKTGAADAAARPAGRRSRAQGGDQPPSAPRARRARSRAWLRPRARSRAPSRPQCDLAIARYDSLTAEEIVARLSELSQIDLAKVDTYERRHENRTTVLSGSARCAATSRGRATTS